MRFEPDASDPDVGEWVEARTKFDVANSTFDVRCPGILGGGAYPRSTTYPPAEVVEAPARISTQAFQCMGSDAHSTPLSR